MFKKLVVPLALTVAAAFGVITVFGQNLRAMHSTSASMLGGSTSRQLYSSYAGGQVGTGVKRISNFSNYGDSPGSAYYQAAADRTTRPVEQSLAPNGWTVVAQDPLSTFAADVDTASYTLARRTLLEGALPSKENVRVEEFVNYFRYRYPAPTDGAFAAYTDLAPSPFEHGVTLMRVGVQAKQVALRDRKTVHLTFLVDVSGSMSSPDRLPLAQQSLRVLLRNLKENDTVALVTYAGDVRMVLPPTSASERAKILSAIDELHTGGGTSMGSGVELAYRSAVKELRPGEVSRVIVLSDGDANIGNTTHEQILRSIEGYVKEGVTLSTIGFGVGNYHDNLMEQLANKGNGNSYYIDSLKQAHRVFEEQLTGTLEVVAKDMKLQVEFNPKAVRRYKLVGYENREIADKDFRNDKVDAGEVGAGHTVTAMYEVELTGVKEEQLATVRLRAKAPNGETAMESAYPVTAAMVHASFEKAPPSFRLAAVAAGFADRLRGNSEVTFAELETTASEIEGSDEDVTELRALIARAAGLASGHVSSR